MSMGRILRRIGIAIILPGAIAVAILLIVQSDVFQPWIQGLVARAIEQRTGTRVEMKKFHFETWHLDAEIDGLILHGLESPDSAPLFRADHATVSLRVISFLGRRITLDRFILDRPQLTVRIEKDGQSNLPKPRVQGKPFELAPLFNMQISLLELRDGFASFNDRRVPLSMQGHNLEFSLNYAGAPGNAASYIGNFQWQQVAVAERDDRPFRFDISAKFDVHPNSFELDELVWKFPHSELDLQAQLPSFAKSEWNLKYRGRLSLADVRTIFREPTTPDGLADFSGQAHYELAQGSSDDWTGSGYFKGHDIRMPYEYFHAGGMATWGNYQISASKLVVPNLNVRALGGSLDGHLDMDFRELAFRTQTHLRGASLAAALAAVDNPNLPVRPLHWDSAIDVVSTNTWNANFLHFRTTGTSNWSPPPTSTAGVIPVTAQIDYDYSLDPEVITVSRSRIATPRSSFDFDGLLGAKDSALEVSFKTGELLDWDDFINVIRGPDAERCRITGEATWTGRIIGPLDGPSFIGHMHTTKASYDKAYLDEIDGDLEYSPNGFRLTNALIRRGSTSSKFALTLGFDGNWNFLAASPWSVDADIDHASSDDLQSMFETHYPVKGFISGELRGAGTRESPVLDSKVVLEELEVKGFRFDRLSGLFHLQSDQIRFSSAELRKGAARVDGGVTYRPGERDVTFDVSGHDIELASIGELQSPLMPAAGQFEFTLKGSGPLTAPVAQGDFHLSNLNLGGERQGNFSGHLESDGRNAHIALASELATGKLQGEATVGLGGDQAISGKLSVQGFDLDPFIVSGFHLKQLTGHSRADGQFTISGTLRQPDSIEVDADIAKLSFDYELVQLENDQDIRVTYHRNEVRVDQAHLHGADTDLQLSGSARFDRDRPLRFALSGGVNLRLLKGLMPDLNAQGRADANVSVGGTIASPQITGRAMIRGGQANYAEFPVGLSNVNGDVVFDKSRLVFDRVTAESGGGELALSGSLTYGEGPLRYEVNAATSTVRIRYPMGMSWLAGGTIQLSGTSQAALISGHVQLQRLLFAQGVDLASFFAAASETTAVEPLSNSTLLQNLRFDVEGQTTPGARIEWAGAEVDMDGDVRLRGSWDRPILLGNIHILGGQMPFRGNTYDLTRGDINFANPFRLDPVLDVEATSTISQYQVTIDFSGPASHLSMTYRSDPPLPQTEIIGLLALGRTGQETGPVSQAASQNYGATALLSEAISSGLGGRIEHLFGISQFRVDPFVAGTATESNAAARVTIEEQLAHDLTITYSTNAATSNQYQMIQVEYAVSRGLSVVFLRDINGTNGLDIKWVKRLK